jgi:hemerythrin-like domain-containing protein
VLQRFAALYDQHLQHEDRLIYPAARAVLDAPSQQSMGREMAVRRGAEKS